MENPQAFPCPATPHYSPEQTGMTLRDYFAAKAMQSLLPQHGDKSADEVARVSYVIADAMLKARTQ